MSEGLALILFTIYTVGMIVYNCLLGDGTRWEYYGVFQEDEDVRALKVAFWPLIFAFFVIVGIIYLGIYVYRRFKGED